MRLGLLADIHEDVPALRAALGLFARRGVEKVLHLGDVCRMHHHLDETCRVLEDAGVEGVWGNHDLGLCRGVDDQVRGHFSPGVLRYMGTLGPALACGDCLCTHVEPWLDPHDIFQLWYFGGLPDTPEKLAKSFDAVPQRLLFCGHVHRWFLGTPEGPCEWAGEGPLRLAPPRRYLLILHALVEGHCATYDTDTFEFTPLRLAITPSSYP
jgi:hypothetical protein